MGDVGLGDKFWGMTPKHKQQNKKINKWDHIQTIKLPCKRKINKMKAQPT